MPERRSLIPVARQFTSAEMDLLKRGVIPMQMEDKWFIFFQRNRLYLHRSWTGFCVYVAHFKRRRDGHVLHLIEANRDAEQYAEQDDAYDARLFFYILDLLLLGRQTPFPQKAGESPDTVPIHQWSQVGQAMLSEAGSGSDGPAQNATPAAGLLAALDQAAKENYLGDPKVVSKLLSDFSADALQRRASAMGVEEANICDQGHALALADIFLGKVPAFAPMIPWNSPGHIDKWLANELYLFEIARETAELTVANAMVCYLDQVYAIEKDMAQSPLSDEWRNTEMNKNNVHYTNLLIGIPQNDSDDDDDDHDERVQPGG